MTLQKVENEKDPWEFPTLRGKTTPLTVSICDDLSRLALSDTVSANLKEVGTFKADSLAPIGCALSIRALTFPQTVEVKKELKFTTIIANVSKFFAPIVREGQKFHPATLDPEKSLMIALSVTPLGAARRLQAIAKKVEQASKGIHLPMIANTTFEATSAAKGLKQGHYYIRFDYYKGDYDSLLIFSRHAVASTYNARALSVEQGLVPEMMSLFGSLASKEGAKRIFLQFDQTTYREVYDVLSKNAQFLGSHPHFIPNQIGVDKWVHYSVFDITGLAL